jgi:hypothetical protein
MLPASFAKPRRPGVSPRIDQSVLFAMSDAISATVLILEEEAEVFGDNPWGHGLTPENQVVLEKFVQYAHEQGYIPTSQRLVISLPPSAGDKTCRN